MKYTIDKKRWLRGEGSSNSKLLRSQDQKMCCLGFVAIQNRMPSSFILDREDPADTCFEWPKWIYDSESNLDYKNSLIMVNDDKEMFDEERMQILTKLFAIHGDEIEFID